MGLLLLVSIRGRRALGLPCVLCQKGKISVITISEIARAFGRGCELVDSTASVQRHFVLVYQHQFYKVVVREEDEFTPGNERRLSFVVVHPAGTAVLARLCDTADLGTVLRVVGPVIARACFHWEEAQADRLLRINKGQAFLNKLRAMPPMILPGVSYYTVV